MSLPENGKPPAAAVPSATALAPAPPPPPRRVAAMSAKKGFQATSGVEKLKGYLREVPKLHDQLTQIIEALRVTWTALQTTTDQVQRLVRQWEEEQKHVRPEGVHGAGGSPAPAPVASAPPAPPVGAPVPAPPGGDGSPAGGSGAGNVP